jgi:hypothetical protein
MRKQLPHYQSVDYERAAAAVRDSRQHGRWWAFYNWNEYRHVIASALSVAANVAKQEETRAAARD